MHHHYKDIRSRIPEPPVWFDEFAVPRWSDFGPRETANIYCQTCALVLIACQDCGAEFKVCFSSGNWEELIEVRPPLWDLIKTGSLHYGDPPNVECCPAGPTMNCLDIRVLEAWEHDRKSFEWVRKPEYELALADSENSDSE